MANEIKDPGIGTKIDEKVRRMINADGSYNVIKKGSTKGIRDIFKYLVEISWTWFFTILFVGYIIFNLIFTIIYLYFGSENILGVSPDNLPACLSASSAELRFRPLVGMVGVRLLRWRPAGGGVCDQVWNGRERPEV